MELLERRDLKVQQEQQGNLVQPEHQEILDGLEVLDQEEKSEDVV
jgi:hypothetical protein